MLFMSIISSQMMTRSDPVAEPSVPDLSARCKSHRIHVWYIYQHWGYMDGIHVTIYSSTMDPMGISQGQCLFTRRWNTNRPIHTSKEGVGRRSSCPDPGDRSASEGLGATATYPAWSTFTKNDGKIGKIQHFSWENWENSRFRLGHVQVRKVLIITRGYNFTCNRNGWKLRLPSFFVRLHGTNRHWLLYGKSSNGK